MLPYWILFSATAAYALAPKGRDSQGVGILASALLWLVLAVFVGLRFRIGTDWDNYDFIFLDIARSNLFEALINGDPGYNFVNWIVANLGGDIWHVNLLFAALFAYGLLRFCAILPLPRLALVAALPTLTIVTAMGYTRQAGAIACVMLAIEAYRGSFGWRWLLWLTLGVTFHKSAIFMLPLFVLAASRNRSVNIAVGAGLGAILLSTFVFEGLQGLFIRYLQDEVQSSGTLQRLALAVIPAALFFTIKDRDQWLGERAKLWRNIAIASLLLVPAYFAINSSTAVDRIALLLSPLQLLFYSLFPLSVTRTPLMRNILIIAIIIFNAVILGTWLLLSEHSRYWLPYRNVLLERHLY